MAADPLPGLPLSYSPEAGLKDDAIVAAKDDRTTMKIESITRDRGDVKVTVGRTDEAVRYLVRTIQEERRRHGQ